MSDVSVDRQGHCCGLHVLLPVFMKICALHPLSTGGYEKQ
jgi:hypothetical protein